MYHLHLIGRTTLLEKHTNKNKTKSKTKSNTEKEIVESEIIFTKIVKINFIELIDKIGYL